MGALKNGYILLGIILGHAPTGDAQAFMAMRYSQIVTEVQKDFEMNHDLEVEKVMVGILNDGLKYGNWPWRMVSVTTGEH
jgi:hypothetical protein